MPKADGSLKNYSVGSNQSCQKLTKGVRRNLTPTDAGRGFGFHFSRGGGVQERGLAQEKIYVISGSEHVCGQKYDTRDNFSATRWARTALFGSRPPAATTFPAILEHFLPESWKTMENHEKP